MKAPNLKRFGAFLFYSETCGEDISRVIKKTFQEEINVSFTSFSDTFYFAQKWNARISIKK
jgi:hypothetical protein